MTISSVDVAVLVAYFVATILVGLWVSKRGSKDMDSYFLGGKSLPWYLLGISDASGMFDISGTMLMVAWLFVYGLKSIWIPFLWPVFNQIFLMMFLIFDVADDLSYREDGHHQQDGCKSESLVRKRHHILRFSLVRPT